MKRVLVVDDSVEIRRTINFLLKTKGFIVFEANDGQECIRILKEEDPMDLVILDLKMPNMDGKEALKLIRDDLNLKDLPVLIHTAFMSEFDEVFFRENASEIINKPATVNDLINIIDMYLL